jgi:hypothetical protein
VRLLVTRPGVTACCFLSRDSSVGGDKTSLWTTPWCWASYNAIQCSDDGGPSTKKRYCSVCKTCKTEARVGCGCGALDDVSVPKSGDARGRMDVLALSRCVCVCVGMCRNVAMSQCKGLSSMVVQSIFRSFRHLLELGTCLIQSPYTTPRWYASALRYAHNLPSGERAGVRSS